MKKYIIILFASLMATSLQAQDTPSAESSIEHASITAWKEREIYQKVYELVQTYALNATVSESEEEFYFRKLFVSDTLQITNDLMNLSQEATLTVDDYVKALKEATSVEVMVRNLKKIGSIKETEDAYNLRVAFEKSISYSNGGTYFVSEKFFGSPYQLLVDLSIDKYTMDCKISGITQKSPLVFLNDYEHFKVLVRTSEDENKRNSRRDDNLYIDNHHKVVWSRNQVMLHPENTIWFNGDRVDEETISQNTRGGRKIRAKYNDQSFRIRANMGYSLSGFNKLDGAKSGITQKDGEMSFGIDFGYMFPSNGKFNVGIFAGVGLSSNKFEMNLSEAKSTIKECKEDEDRDTYNRHYSANGITQKFSASEFTIPVYLDFEYKVVRKMFVYADLGVRMQMTADKWDANIDSYETYGVYSGYDNLTINDYINGFGNHSGEIGVDKDVMESSMSISALMGLGLRLNITKNIAADVGVQYLLGGNSWKKNSDQLFSYTLSGGDKVNLLSQANGIKRNAFRVTLGLIFKF